MPKGRPFPAVEGGCFCGAVRYRMEAPPLFCFACHCADCHKHTGSVFSCFVCIEADIVSSIGKKPPSVTTRVRHTGIIRHQAACPDCGTQLWASGDTNPAILDIKTGTLDHPNLMEPDLHTFIDSKIPWVLLPEGAKTCKGAYDFRKVWPKLSLKRFDAAVRRYQENIEKENGADVTASITDGVGNGDGETEETDKTPTAQSPEEKEDDEEFERRYRETEAALQERLAKLTLKLEGEQKDVSKEGIQEKV